MMISQVVDVEAVLDVVVTVVVINVDVVVGLNEQSQKPTR